MPNLGKKRTVWIVEAQRISEDSFRLTNGAAAPESLDLSELIGQHEADGWYQVGHARICEDRTIESGYSVPVWESSQGGQFRSLFERYHWIVWLDMEGFSRKFQQPEGETDVLLHLHRLMRYLIALGKKAYPHCEERLFIHQIGDGFVIAPDFGDIDLLRPISICVAMHRLAVCGGITIKTAIGLGGIADFSGCYPDEIRDGFASIGAGVMTVSPILGDGIIDSYGLSNTPKCHGPLLLVREDMAGSIPDCFVSKRFQEREAILVDWVHSGSEVSNKILGICLGPEVTLVPESSLRTYVTENPNLPENWRSAANELIVGYS